jgi:hypothetical protein
MESLLHFGESFTWSKIAVGIIILIISAVASYGMVMFAILKIPADYFTSAYPLKIRSNKPFFIRWSLVILKNLFGAFLVVSGVIMIFGPGPGVLTILLGLIMLDIPGKRPLEVKIIQRPAVLSAINNLRARYKKAPLVMD